MRKHRSDGIGDVVGEGILFDAVPDTEDKAPARSQHATRLSVTDDPVGKKHRAELAADDLERRVFERQIECVRLPPFDTVIGPLSGSGIVEHGLVEVGHHVARANTEFWRKRARDHAAAGGRFKHRVGRGCRDKFCHVSGIGLEDQRDHQRVVGLRDRARKHLIALSHGSPLQSRNDALDQPFQSGPTHSNESRTD